MTKNMKVCIKSKFDDNTNDTMSNEMTKNADVTPGAYPKIRHNSFLKGQSTI